MVRRQIRRIIVVCGLSGIVGGPLIAVAQTGAGGPQTSDFGFAPGGARIINVVPFDVPVERRARLLNDLRETLTKKLALTKEQDEKLKRIVEADIQALRKLNALDPQAPTPSGQPRPTAEEIVELKKELEEARETGDDARAERILNRILYTSKPVPAQRALFNRLASMPRQLRQDIMAVVPEERQRLAAKIWDRWWTLYPKTPLDNPVRCVLRAISDPDLGIEPELQARLRQKVLSAVKSSPPAYMERSEQLEAAQRLVEELKEQIPPHRWDHFMATWTELKRQAERDYELLMKLRNQEGETTSVPGE